MPLDDRLQRPTEREADKLHALHLCKTALKARKPLSEEGIPGPGREPLKVDLASEVRSRDEAEDGPEVWVVVDRSWRLLSVPVAAVTLAFEEGNCPLALDRRYIDPIARLGAVVVVRYYIDV